MIFIEAMLKNCTAFVAITDITLVLICLVPSIKFTIEKENDGVISFLDVKIHRKESCLKYEIYCKPTNNLSYVHYYSNHTEKIKISIFSSMFLRAFRIVSPEFFNNEINLVNEIGISKIS